MGLKTNLLTALDFFYGTQCLPTGHYTLPCLLPRQGTVYRSSLGSVPGEVWMKPQTHLTLCGQKYYVNRLTVASSLAAVLTFMCFVTFANHFIRITYLNKTANNCFIYTIHDVRFPSNIFRTNKPCKRFFFSSFLCIHLDTTFETLGFLCENQNSNLTVTVQVRMRVTQFMMFNVLMYTSKVMLRVRVG